MKIAKVKINDSVWAGIVDVSAQTIELLTKQQSYIDPVISIIQQSLKHQPLPKVRKKVDFREVIFMPPITQPSKDVICVGKNYAKHAAEYAHSGYDSSSTDINDVIPEAPIMFTKAARTMIGASDDIIVPWNITQSVDYEAELGVIIGREGRFISEESAYDHVWGYTVVNDMTARDLQSRHKQWLLGKSIDTFCPIGPWIVTADEVDPEDMDVSCWVNGERRQHANTRDLIFNIPSIIAAASASMTMCPGDIIATGTPAGVGVGFQPPKFLKIGDSVKVEISGIGVIENTIT
ncbi:MAG: fumarylacetoacetate hydrolase family protein [Porticoccaceae bacterium]|nr:fumarylacetoacetate hydrolase family protein [Porticoccaceae bacterium]